MVFGRLFERGLGQIVAPDKNYKPPERDRSTSTRSNFSVWQFVAPDPNFEKKRRSASNKKSSKPKQAPASPTVVKEASPDEISQKLQTLSVEADTSEEKSISLCSECQSKLCASCQKLTIATTTTNDSIGSPPLFTPRAQGRSSSSLAPHTGSTSRANATPDPLVQEKVLSAAQNLAETMVSPPLLPKTTQNIFRSCASSVELQENAQMILRKNVSKNPELLLTARDATNYGYTPLMTAAKANNVIAAQILFECSSYNTKLQEKMLSEANLQGKAAIHIASEQGNTEMVEFLLCKHSQIFGTDSPLPIDLTGRTPLGVMITSSVAKARTNKGSLMRQLYTPTDLCVLGSPLPAPYRVQLNRAVQTVLATSEIPGKRVLMEDFTVVQNADHATVFSVGDGHSDAGRVSKFVSEHLVSAMVDCVEASPGGAAIDWQESAKSFCLNTDAELKAAKLKGGSVAVLVAITMQEIAVANVGDCRCILLQKQPQQPHDKGAVFSVQALSHDHKPNAQEEVARIENAGLEVMEERFEENGQEIVIPKVVLSDGNRMACSRSFGDFEYKAVTKLTDEEQAVTAVPEVIVHTRCPQDAYLFAACDGVWDVMTNEDVAKFVAERIQQQEEEEVATAADCSNATTTISLSSIGDDLLRECLNRGSGDNMSVVLVGLSSSSSVDGSPVYPKKTLDFTPPELREE